MTIENVTFGAAGATSYYTFEDGHVGDLDVTAAVDRHLQVLAQMQEAAQAAVENADAQAGAEVALADIESMFTAVAERGSPGVIGARIRTTHAVAEGLAVELGAEVAFTPIDCAPFDVIISQEAIAAFARGAETEDAAGDEAVVDDGGPGAEAVVEDVSP